MTTTVQGRIRTEKLTIVGANESSWTGRLQSGPENTPDPAELITGARFLPMRCASVDTSGASGPEVAHDVECLCRVWVVGVVVDLAGYRCRRVGPRNSDVDVRPGFICRVVLTLVAGARATRSRQVDLRGIQIRRRPRRFLAFHEVYRLCIGGKAAE